MVAKWFCFEEKVEKHCLRLCKLGHVTMVKLRDVMIDAAHVL